MTARQKKSTEQFPFPEGHYLSTPSTARRSHSSGSVVSRINEMLGVEGDIFNTHTRDALMLRQQELGLPVTGVVDEATWVALHGGPVPEQADG